MERYGIIYKITNTVNGKVYIGQTTKTLEYRWSAHKHPRSGCIKLQYAIGKYGHQNFTIEAIYSSYDPDDLDDKEMYFISLYQSDKEGYNILSAPRKRCAGSLNPFYGKHHNAETRSKIRAARSRQIVAHSEETKHKIGLANKGQNSGKRRSPATEFKLGIAPWNKGKRIGPAWNKGISQTPNQRERNRLAQQQRCSKVQQISLDGIILSTFASIRDASRCTGITRSCIARCCHHKYGFKTAGGYMWEFIG